MKLKIILIKCSLLTSIFAFAASVFAQTLSTGKVSSIEGSIQVSRLSANGSGTNEAQLGVNSVLFVGDVIKTKSNSRLVIVLEDGLQAVIGENTTIEIRDPQVSPRTLFNILKGRTRVKIEKLGGKPNPYRVTKYRTRVT